MTNSTTNQRKHHLRVVDFVRRPVQLAKFTTRFEIRFVRRVEKLSEVELASLYARLRSAFDADELRHLSVQKEIFERFSDDELWRAA
jgi:hypothetical protein